MANNRIRVIASYVVDWVIVIAAGVAFTIIGNIDPFHQHFSLENYTLQYPHKLNDTISIGVAAALSIGVPVIVIALFTIVIDGLFSHNKPAQKLSIIPGPWTIWDRLSELHCGILGLALGVSASFTITGALKNLIGKPRPDLIARCLPKSGSSDPSPFGLSDISICTQTDQSILQDGFRSFPSGHSSTAFAGLFFLSLYLAGKLHVLDNKGEVWRTLLVLVPTLGAALIAGSRIMDARHHPFDVITGSLLGILTAWGAYRQFFPALSSHESKGRAHPIRSWGKRPQTGYVRTPEGAVDNSGSSNLGATGFNPVGSNNQSDPESGMMRRDQSAPPPQASSTVSSDQSQRYYTGQNQTAYQPYQTDQHPLVGAGMDRGDIPLNSFPQRRQE